MNIALLSEERRFSLALGVAALLHVFSLTALGFSAGLSESKNERSIEVIMEQVQADVEPEHANYIAPTAQLGSGDSDQPNIPSDTVAGVLAEAVGDSVQAVAPVLAKSAEASFAPELTQAESNTTVHIDDQAMFKLESASTQKPRRSEELAALINDLDDARKRYAERPRTLLLSTLSAKSAIEAHYMRVWVDEVERTGNIYYPDEARRSQLSGDVMMEVTILSDGRLHSIDVRHRSGQQVLDDAAIRSVSLAAPYAPFPRELRAQYDRLAIMRIWSFKSGTLSTQANAR